MEKNPDTNSDDNQETDPGNNQDTDQNPCFYISDFINAIFSQDKIAFDNNFPEDIATLKYVSKFIDTQLGSIALYTAIIQYSGDLYFIKRLIAAGVDINDRDYLGDTPLIAAVYKRGYDIIDILLISGADPNIRHSRFGHTALHLAIRCGCPDEYINKLLNAGADPNIKDCDNRTPLFSSIRIQSTSKEIFLRLLELTTDLNYLDITNSSLLYIAYESDQIIIFEKLLASGADPHIKIKNGVTIYQIIKLINECKYEFLDILLKYRPDIENL